MHNYTLYIHVCTCLSLFLSLSQTVFLFTDGHVAQEGFLELINNMLTSGMVPALFPDDEKETVIGQVHIHMYYMDTCICYMHTCIGSR